MQYQLYHTARGVATDFGLGGTRPKRRLIISPKRRLMTKLPVRAELTTGGGGANRNFFGLTSKESPKGAYSPLKGAYTPPKGA